MLKQARNPDWPSQRDTAFAAVGRRRTSWFTWAARINFIAGLAFAATFIYFALRARFTVPYADDWAWLLSLQDHPFTKGLWQPHNEHIVVIPRLLLWANFWFWGWPGYATLFAALFCHGVVAGVLALTCIERERDEAILLIGSVLFLSFLTYELQSAVFPASVLFPLVAASSVVAILALTKCAGNSSQRSVRRWVSLSALMSVVGMLCLTNGLIVPFVLVGLSSLLRLGRRAAALFISIGVAGFAARYLVGGVPHTVLTASPLATVRFALSMLAGPIAAVSPPLAALAGSGFAAVAFWTLWRRAPARTPASTLLVGIIWFVIGSAAMGSLGRAQMDPSVAAESRYTDLAAIGWSSMLLLALPSGLARRRIGHAVAVLLPLASIAALPMQVFVGDVWVAKADYLHAASLALAVGADDEDWLTQIDFLGGAHIDRVLGQFRGRDVAFLAFPDGGQRVGESSTPVAPCNGGLEAVVLRSRAAGLSVKAHLYEGGQTIRILDSARRVRGMARHAPLVQHAGASANDFVWAVLDVWAGRIDTHGDWLGFTTWGSGPPFRAQLTDENGRVLCEAPVACCAESELAASRPELILRGGLPEGWLDLASCTAIGGWVWDATRPNRPVDVRISVSGGKDYTLSAGTFRPDLLQLGKGNGRHAFTVGASQLGLGAGTWQVKAAVAATGAPLNGSPQTVVCKDERR